MRPCLILQARSYCTWLVQFLKIHSSSLACSLRFLFIAVLCEIYVPWTSCSFTQQLLVGLYTQRLEGNVFNLIFVITCISYVSYYIFLSGQTVCWFNVGSYCFSILLNFVHFIFIHVVFLVSLYLWMLLRVHFFLFSNQHLQLHDIMIFPCMVTVVFSEFSHSSSFNPLGILHNYNYFIFMSLINKIFP